MTCSQLSIPLTAEQQGQIFGILSVGCDRETAVNFIGCSIADLGRAMQQDASFAATVRRTEAAAELSHMRNVQQAAKDERHWRASVWWLERRSPERYGPQGAGVVTSRQLKAYLEMVADNVNEEVHDEGDRQRMLARLEQLIESAEQMILYGTAGAAPPDELSSTDADPDVGSDALGIALPSESY